MAWLLSQTAHLLNQRLCMALEAEGLTVGQWWVLRLLSDGAGHRMGEVADHAMLPAPTLTKAVDQLVAANLVDRRADRQDRRRVLISLTARGRRLQRQLARQVSPIAIVGDALDDAEVAQLTQLLQRLR